MAAVNTQFSIAIHIMVCIGSAKKDMTSATLAKSVNAYPSFVRRILSKLSKAGLVETSTGKTGSSTLGKKPKDITLLDIYRAVEAPKAFAIHKYPEQEICKVSCGIKECMEDILDKTQKAMEDSLKKTSLAEVIKNLNT